MWIFFSDTDNLLTDRHNLVLIHHKNVLQRDIASIRAMMLYQRHPYCGGQSNLAQDTMDVQRRPLTRYKKFRDMSEVMTYVSLGKYVVQTGPLSYLSPELSSKYLVGEATIASSDTC